MTNLDKFALKDNPFSATPIFDEIIWAGMNKLKKEIERRIELSIKTSPSALILNFGDYGSGKTHAARYFTSKLVLKELTKRLGISQPLALHLNLPRVASGCPNELTISILSKIGLAKLKSDLGKVKTSLETKKTGSFNNVLNNICGDSELEKILEVFLSSEDDDLDKIGRVLFGSASYSDLKNLKLTKKLESGSDFCRLMSTIFNLLTYKSEGITPVYPSINIWIDEFEDIKSLSGKEQEGLTAYLRNLIDWSPTYLVLFINFTLSPINDIQDLTVFLGEALSSRIRVKIEFTEPTPEEAKIYVNELLNHRKWRIEEPILKSNKFFPFNEKTVDFLLSSISPRTIRRINEIFSLVIELALLDKYVEEIDDAFIKKNQIELGLSDT